MAKQYDFKTEWEKTRKQLVKFSKEAAAVAKKGEEELVKITRKSKLHIDSTALTLKKEHLYHLIGKEYVKQIRSKKESAKLKKLIKELDQVAKEQKNVKKKIKVSPKK